jgi:hypothetical protein
MGEKKVRERGESFRGVEFCPVRVAMLSQQQHAHALNQRNATQRHTTRKETRRALQLIHDRLNQLAPLRRPNVSPAMQNAPTAHPALASHSSLLLPRRLLDVLQQSLPNRPGGKLLLVVLEELRLRGQRGLHLCHPRCRCGGPARNGAGRPHRRGSARAG